jgi:RNA polymerase sigma-70 factor, ECF subfamily
MSPENRDDRFVRLLQAHERAMRRLAASYERDAARQQDLVQDIWLAVWQALPRFRGDCSERTFVFRIAHNRAVSHIDYAQRRRTEPLLEETPVASADPDPEHSLSIQQRQKHLRDAVQKLPVVLRQVVVLALEGLSHAEIGDIIGITDNNVAVRLSRARNMLSRLMGAVETTS